MNFFYQQRQQEEDTTTATTTANTSSGEDANNINFSSLQIVNSTSGTSGTAATAAGGGVDAGCGGGTAAGTTAAAAGSTSTNVGIDLLVPPEVLVSNSIQNVKQVDLWYAQELNQLSLKERNEVYSELHGVADRVEETPELITKSLHQLNIELYKLVSNTDNKEMNELCTAYQIVVEENPKYVKSPKFLLQFLRVEKFNPETAAIRILHYFTEKLALFGRTKLCQEYITLADLSHDDLIPLQSGYLQWLTTRDRSGRSIWFGAMGLRNWKERSNILRALWYFLSAALEDEETQKCGIIIIPYMFAYNQPQSQSEGMSNTSSTSAPKSLDRMTGWYFGKLLSCIPIRVEALHVCCDQLQTRIMAQLSLLVIGSRLRLRTRCHYGTPLEVLYDMLSFGIPSSSFPINVTDWSINLTAHLQWIIQRQIKENNLQQQQQKEEEEITTTDDDEHNNNEEEVEGKQADSNSGSGNEDDVPMVISSTEDKSEDNNNNNNSRGGGNRAKRRRKQQQVQNNKGGSATTAAADAATAVGGGSGVIVIVQPNPQDVLFGKRKMVHHHPGNTIYRSFIESNRDRYETSTKVEKTDIAKEILTRIKSHHGGRFLKPLVSTTTTTSTNTSTTTSNANNNTTSNDTNKGGTTTISSNDMPSSLGWVEVSDQVARDKIGHAFRNMRVRGPPITLFGPTQPSLLVDSLPTATTATTTVGTASTTPSFLPPTKRIMTPTTTAATTTRSKKRSTTKQTGVKPSRIGLSASGNDCGGCSNATMGCFGGQSSFLDK